MPVVGLEDVVEDQRDRVALDEADLEALQRVDELGGVELAEECGLLLDAQPDVHEAENGRVVALRDAGCGGAVLAVDDVERAVVALGDGDRTEGRAVELRRDPRRAVLVEGALNGRVDDEVADADLLDDRVDAHLVGSVRDVRRRRICERTGVNRERSRRVCAASSAVTESSSSDLVDHCAVQASSAGMIPMRRA